MKKGTIKFWSSFVFKVIEVPFLMVLGILRLFKSRKSKRKPGNDRKYPGPGSPPLAWLHANYKKGIAKIEYEDNSWIHCNLQEVSAQIPDRKTTYTTKDGSRCNLKKLSCTCLEFERREHYPVNDFRRLCYHLLGISRCGLQVGDELTHAFLERLIQNRDHFPVKDFVRGKVCNDRYISYFIAYKRLHYKTGKWVVDFTILTPMKKKNKLTHAFFNPENCFWFAENPFPRGLRADMSYEANQLAKQWRIAG